MNKNQTVDSLPMNLKHFSTSEFKGQASYLSIELLLKLDTIRDVSGYNIMISPAPGGIIRHQGKAATSQHNIDKWGEGRAIDIMPYVKKFGKKRALTLVEAQDFVTLAKKLGFRGIGVYPTWKPFPGFHLDVRLVSEFGIIHTWSRIPVNERPIYLGIDVAWSNWPI